MGKLIIAIWVLTLFAVSSIVHADMSATLQATPLEQAATTTPPEQATTTTPAEQAATTTQAISDSDRYSFIELDRERPNYVLPYYYTQSPYQSVYNGNTPNNQAIMRNEFKAQMSLRATVWHDIFNTQTSLNIAYTQLMYWQFYAKSQYFRETNYEPSVFLAYKYGSSGWETRLGAVHQSNGRGGSLERSWNRVYIDQIYRCENLYGSIEGWMLVDKSNSSNLHNPDITDYLGHGRWRFAYSWKKIVLSFMSRNNFESGFKRGAEELAISYPISKQFRLFVQGFSGYGQSLIEYDHYTNAVGVGISYGEWV